MKILPTDLDRALALRLADAALTTRLEEYRFAVLTARYECATYYFDNVPRGEAWAAYFASWARAHAPAYTVRRTGARVHLAHRRV